MDVCMWLFHASRWRLFGIGIATRLVILLWMLFSSRVIGGGESYDSCETFYPSRYQSVSFLSHWDNVHFRHVATHGYSHEHVHAFFPGVPMLVVLLETLNLPALSLHVLAMIAYGVALVALREYTKMVFDVTADARAGQPAGTRTLTSPCFADPREIGAAVFLLLLSPSNVFTVVGYSESFYACAAMLGLWFAALDQPLLRSRQADDTASKPPGIAFAGAMLCFACAALLRSNGFLLGALTMVPSVLVFLRRPLLQLRHRKLWVVHTSLRGLCCCFLLVPYIATNYMGWKRYALSTVSEGGVSVDAPEAAVERCSMMGFYPMIQALYWNVGWFRQWTLQNSPNFLIAAPPILFGMQSLWRHWLPPRELIRLDHSVHKHVHVWHLVFLWYLAITTIHVQVVNRLVFACPALYWIGARQLVRAPSSWWTRLQIAYCLVCSVLGPLMFANHMNWT